MNTYIGITISILIHLFLGALLSYGLPAKQADFGIKNGSIVVRLQKSPAILKKKKTISKEIIKDTEPKEVKNTAVELPLGFDKQIKSFVAPKYPVYAIRKSIEGRVLLSLDIDKQGLVSKVFIKRSSGHELLDSSAKSAALNWVFKPMLEKRNLTKEIIFKLR